MNTTIALRSETKNNLQQFGNKGETYDDIVTRLLKSAQERQLQELLMNTKGCITAKEALEKAKNRWQK